MKLSSFTVSCSVLLLLAQCGCKPREIRKAYRDHNALIHETQNPAAKPFLKAHMKNGEVAIFSQAWTVDNATNSLQGQGILYDFNRRPLMKTGDIRLSLDSVVIFETNRQIRSSDQNRIAALAIIGAANLGLATFCIINPKVCFGSCPTFYTDETADKDVHYSNSEGFSEAIAPFLEQSDIDAFAYNGSGTTVSITMKNEAMETHCVNDVKLYAVKRNKGEEVFQSPLNEFYLCDKVYPLLSAVAGEGGISTLLRDADKVERFSLSDEHDLATKEEIVLTFNNEEAINNPGLVIHFRQTMMTTFFIYNALAYMGDEVTDMIAHMAKQKNPIEQWAGLSQALGDIEVHAWDEETQKWKYQGGLYETGPIAINQQFLPLPLARGSKKTKVRLVMTKGLWRLDHVALAEISGKVEPLKIPVSEITCEGTIDTTALNAIHDPARYLVTMPGNSFRFRFDLPSEATNYSLFLYSRGYYLEWMREGWYAEKNLAKLRQLILAPSRYLRSEAKQYKVYESQMEKDFWNSRITHSKYTYYAH